MMKTLCLFVILVAYEHAGAQWFNNGSTFTTQNGLSNNTITCLQKDSLGFIWIGTHEGLNRYDGTSFVNVLSNAKNNLPSNNITRVEFISNTLMAVATNTGLCLLNTTTFSGKKIDLPYLPAFPGTAFYIADILYKKDTRELWVATWHGLFVLDTAGNLKKKMMALPSEMSHGLFARHLLKDIHGLIYFYSQQKKGFYYPDFDRQQSLPEEKRFEGFTMNALMNNDYSLMGLQMLNQQCVCIFSKLLPTGREERIVYYNISSGRSFNEAVQVNGPYEKRLSNAYPLNDSIFIINSFFGEPSLYNANQHELKPATDHPLWFTSWPDGLATYICSDNNNIWVGTSKNLLQFPLKTGLFKTNPLFTNEIKNLQSLVSCNYGIYSNQALWVACLGAGLFRIDTLHNTFSAVFDGYTPAEFKRKIISTEVHDAGRSLWLFSLYGPAAVDPATKKISLINATNKDSSFDAVASYPLADSKGDIWATLPDGITKYNIITNTFINYRTRYKGGTFPLLRAGPKTEDNKGNIWMVRDDTLLKMDPITEQFSISLLKKNGRALRPVTCLASDDSDIIYMSVAGSLGMYSVSTGNMELYTKQTGIISTVINEMVSDKEGNAWIATEGGLVFYDRQKKKFASFTKADGLPDDNIISINFTDPEKKTLFLGFSKTYCLFAPRTFLLEGKVPENVITGMEAGGQTFDVNQKQVLSYKENNIFFTYTGINYNQGQQNNYACMLENFDQDWKYTGTERRVNYINLPPGNYVFKIKSANYQGEWNEIPATLAFEITPPFWQRWWFRILVACGLIFSAFYLIKKRERTLQKENNVKLQLSELRMQALRAQMNPHFIFNSLNSIQNYILSNNTMDAAGYLSKFAKLMRRILDQSKSNFLPLAEVMETLQLYVEIEAFRFNHEFSYTFDIEQNDELLDMDMPPMLLQPFVENAILHGLMPKKGDKKLLIRCRLVDKTVEIIIDDNGVGRSNNMAQAGHVSQGGKLTTGMLESLQQLKNSKVHIEITDKTDQTIPAGTIVKLLLPLN